MAEYFDPTAGTKPDEGTDYSRFTAPMRPQTAFEEGWEESVTGKGLQFEQHQGVALAKKVLSARGRGFSDDDIFGTVLGDKSLGIFHKRAKDAKAKGLTSKDFVSTVLYNYPIKDPNEREFYTNFGGTAMLRDITESVGKQREDGTTVTYDDVKRIIREKNPYGRYGEQFLAAAENMGDDAAVQELGKIYPQQPHKTKKNVVDSAITATVSMVADLPLWLAAYKASGGPATGPVSLMGASAIVAAIGTLLEEKIENGEISSDKSLYELIKQFARIPKDLVVDGKVKKEDEELWERLKRTAEATGKAGAVGLGAGLLGRIPNALVASGVAPKLGYTGNGYEKGIAHKNITFDEASGKWVANKETPTWYSELAGDRAMNKFGQGRTALSKSGERLKIGGEVGGFVVGQPLVEGQMPQSTEEWAEHLAKSVVPIVGIHYAPKAFKWIRDRLKRGEDPNKILEEIQTQPKDAILNEINRYETGYDTGSVEGTEEPVTSEMKGQYRTEKPGGKDIIQTNEPWLALEEPEPETGRYTATDAMGAPVGRKGMAPIEEPAIGPRGEDLTKGGKRRGMTAAVDTEGVEGGREVSEYDLTTPSGERYTAKPGTEIYYGEKGPVVYDPRSGKVINQKQIAFEVIDPTTGEHLGWQSPLGFSRQWDMSLAEFMLRQAEREFHARGAEGKPTKFTEGELGAFGDMVLRRSPTEADFLMLSHKIKAALDKPAFQRDAIDQILLQFANRSVWKAVLDKLSNRKVINEQYGVDVKDLTRSDVAGIAKEAFKPTGPIYTPPSYGEPRSYPSPPPTGPKPKRGRKTAQSAEKAVSDSPPEDGFRLDKQHESGEQRWIKDNPDGSKRIISRDKDGNVFKDVTIYEQDGIDSESGKSGKIRITYDNKNGNYFNVEFISKSGERWNLTNPDNSVPVSKVLGDTEGFYGIKKSGRGRGRTAITETAKGLDEAFTGLSELFGGGKSLTMGGISGFNAESYAKAKPHFEAAWNHLKAAGKSYRELYDTMVERFGDMVKPYITKFINEIKGGEVRGQKEEGKREGLQVGGKEVAPPSKTEARDFVKAASKQVQEPLRNQVSESTVTLGKDVVRGGKVIFRRDEPVVLTKYENGFEIKRGGQKVRIEDLDEITKPPAVSAPSTPPTQPPPTGQPGTKITQIKSGDTVYYGGKPVKVAKVYDRGDAYSGTRLSYQIKFPNGHTKWVKPSDIRAFTAQPTEQKPYQETALSIADIERKANALVDTAREGTGKIPYTDPVTGEEKFRYYKYLWVKIGDTYIKGSADKQDPNAKAALRRKVIEELNRLESKKMAAEMQKPGQPKPTTPPPQRVSTGKTAVERMAEELGAETEPVQAQGKESSILDWTNRFKDIVIKVTTSEKTPNRRMSPDEVALMEKDWREYSRSRNYSEEEISDFQKYLDLVKEGKELGIPEEDIGGFELTVKESINRRTIPHQYSKTVERTQRQEMGQTVADAEKRAEALRKERDQEAKRIAAENEGLRKAQATREADQARQLLRTREELLKRHAELKAKGPDTVAERLRIAGEIEQIEEVLGEAKLAKAKAGVLKTAVDKVKEDLSTKMILFPAIGLMGGFDVDKDGNVTWDAERAFGAAGVSMAMFIGPKSKLLNYRQAEGLRLAREKWKAAGIDRWTKENNGEMLKIQKESDGWFLGPDGKVRYEDSDKKMTLRKPFEKWLVNSRDNLYSAVKHDVRYEQYPGLKDFKIERSTTISTDGATDIENKIISINAGLDSTQARRVIIHEMNHIVDFYEGRYGGSNLPYGMAMLMEPRNSWHFLDVYNSLLSKLTGNGASVPMAKQVMAGVWMRQNHIRDLYSKMVDNEIERGAARRDINKSDLSVDKASELYNKIREHEKIDSQLKEEINKAWQFTKSETFNNLIRRTFELSGYRRVLGEAEARLAEERADLSQEQIRQMSILGEPSVTKEMSGLILSDKISPTRAALVKEKLTPQEQQIIDESRKGTIAQQDPRLVLEGYRIGRKQKVIDKQLDADRLKEILKTGKRLFVDVSGNAKEVLLKQLGIEGQKAKMDRNLVYGAPSKTAFILSKGDPKIYGELTKAEMNILDDIIETRCTISVLKRNPNYTPSLGQNLTSQQQALELIKQRYGQDVYDKLSKRADVYFDDMRSALKMAYEGGLIDKITYDKLKGNEYKRKQLQDLIDPEDRSEMPKLMGAKISVRTSGIEYLREGSQRIYDTDSHWARAQVWTSVVTRVAKNRANQSLADISRQNPQNGIIRELQPWEKPKVGESAISWHENGQVKQLAMPEEMAREWVTTDPEISKGFAYFLSWFTGTKLLKAFATGYNPAFILTNIPRDMFLIWGATDEYSSFVPKAMLQMGKDIALAFKDAATKTGRYDKYIDQGGGIELLTYYGRGDIYNHKLNMLQKMAGWAGETSELMTRLALRDRTIRNRMESLGRAPTPEERAAIEREATEIARTYLDFNQGGSWAKSIDKIVPYFNASIQGSRGLFRYLQDNPKMAAWKMAQVATLSAMVYMYNQSSAPEVLDEIPEFDKVNNFIIGIPGATFVDNKGDTRNYYVKIAKDQGMQVVASMVEAAFEYNRTGKVPTNQLWEAAKNIIQTQLLPPIMGAYAGYAWNVDAWTGEPVYKGKVGEVEAWAERDAKTIGFFDDIGKLTGLSPMRLRAAMGRIIPESNAFWTGALGGYKVMTGELQDDWNRKQAAQVLSDLPAVRRILSTTNPYWAVKEESKQHKIASNTRRIVNNRAIDNLADRYFRDRTEETAEKIDKFLEQVRAENPYESERLEKRIIRHYEFWQVPTRQWWVDLSMLNDPEERAEMFHERYNKSNSEKKAEMIRILDSIKGISSDRFDARMDELMRKQAQ